MTKEEVLKIEEKYKLKKYTWRLRIEDWFTKMYFKITKYNPHNTHK